MSDLRNVKLLLDTLPPVANNTPVIACQEERICIQLFDAQHTVFQNAVHILA
jgi:hypothetical protein